MLFTGASFAVNPQTNGLGGDIDHWGEVLGLQTIRRKILAEFHFSIMPTFCLIRQPTFRCVHFCVKNQIIRWKPNHNGWRAVPTRGQHRVPGRSRKTGLDEKPIAPETLAFANRLIMTRKQRGYDSAAKFAKAIGVEDETYRTWERGIREPAIPNICKIARKLDISLDYLILGDLPSYKTPTKPSH